MRSLRRRREKLGMSVADLSRMTGISANFISEIELGRETCSFESLEKLVFALSDYDATPRKTRTATATAVRPKRTPSR